MGRFAPSPSGHLHLGSLYAAAASYLDARAHAGRWLLRMEDLDQPRVVAGAADAILRTVEAFGFEWDGTVLYQQQRMALYADALESLRGQTFQCSCSRSELAEDRYAGQCRSRPRRADVTTATRLRVDPGPIQLSDRVQGVFRQDVAAAAGDLLLKRRDGIYAYLLAVIVDDAAQGITHVVRGADLLDNTPRQIYLQQRLNLPRPIYAHVPVLTEMDGAKLSKSARSVRLHTLAAAAQLVAVFHLLGLYPPADLAQSRLDTVWKWGIKHWDIRSVPPRLFYPLDA